MCMDIIDLMGQILKQSEYEGRFTLDEVLHYSSVHSLTGIGVSGEGAHAFYLVLYGGEPDGAILVDEKGTLFGDAAVLHLTGGETFDLSRVSPPVIEALVSRCRVDIPTIGTPIRQRVGILCLTVRGGEEPLGGAHVSIRKGKLVITSDVTDSKGRVCFRLLNGRYMCVVSDRNTERTRCIIEFHEPQVEMCVDIGGTEDESK